MYGTKDTRKYEDLPGAISSSSNTAFPFRKYKTNFIPYAPYKSLHDTAKYTPNPDWLLYRPWGYKFRKARYVYVPEDENSSKSIEIERVMRETRLRELVKGVYSSSYGDSVNTKTMTYEADQEKMVKKDIKSIEAEAVVTHKEAERRHLTSAQKRRRNETLAIGLSRTDLIKSESQGTQASDVNNLEVKRTVSDAAVEEPPSSSSTSDMAVNEPLTEDHSEDLVDTSNKQMDPKLNMPEKEKSPPKKDILMKQPNSTTETPSNSLVTPVKKEEEEEIKSNEGSHAGKEKETAPNEESTVNKEDEIAKSEESSAKITEDEIAKSEESSAKMTEEEIPKKNYEEKKEEIVEKEEISGDKEEEKETSCENQEEQEIDMGANKDCSVNNEADIAIDPEIPEEKEVERKTDSEIQEVEVLEMSCVKGLSKTEEIVDATENKDDVDNVNEGSNGDLPNGEEVVQDEDRIEARDIQDTEQCSNEETTGDKLGPDVEDNEIEGETKEGEQTVEAAACPLSSVSEASNLEYKEEQEQEDEEEEGENSVNE